MKKVALIDADVLVWKASVVSQENVNFGTDEEPDWHHDANEEFAEARVRNMISAIKMKVQAREVVLCLSPQPDGEREHSVYWRHDVLPSYKQHRPAKEAKYSPPLLLFGHVRKFMTKHYNTVSEPRLEADDLMGILATEPQAKERRIICSIDKDMRQVPGFLYNPDKASDGVIEISQIEGDLQHMYQTLVGDTCDNYKGCPGIGPKKAIDIVAGGWEYIVKAFEAEGLTEADALVQARVSRILRWDEFDFKTREVKLWTPPNASNRPRTP